jgi:tRNA (cmo5U34)-methyltransferase
MAAVPTPVQENTPAAAPQKAEPFTFADFTWLTGNARTKESPMDGEYDAVISSLALHHLATDEDKKYFYRRIYTRLCPGGVFYNGDVVLASSDILQAVYMRQWRAFMRRSISDEEIEGKWIPSYEAEDRPAKLMDQLAWLGEIGFADVDVLWKDYNFAVYGGVKY